MSWSNLYKISKKKSRKLANKNKEVGPCFFWVWDLPKYSLHPIRNDTFAFWHGILCSFVLWVNEERIKEERWKSRDDVVSILENVSFLMRQREYYYGFCQRNQRTARLWITSIILIQVLLVCNLSKIDGWDEYDKRKNDNARITNLT